MELDSGSEGITLDELQLAARNHGMPLEALRYPVTPLGLHYLLTHYDIPLTDGLSWTVEVAGHVERPSTLTLQQLKARPAAEMTVTMECAGNGRAHLSPRPVSQPWLVEAVGTARWRGTPLGPILEEAGVREGAAEVVFTGLDHGREHDVEQQFQRSLAVEEVLGSDALLAYEMNGVPLPPQHGFPLRLIVPGWYGMTNVKWLTRIEVVEAPFFGYQQEHAYRLRQTEEEPGQPLTRILPRALMVPPGYPDFHTRERFVQLGPCPLDGRAWSGWGEIVSVDVSTDGGRSWDAATLETGGSRWAWRGWSYLWSPEEPGSYELCCRATDSVGNEQPLEPGWNLGGYANNAVQRVPVTVVP
jgi:DMSO/TMAO reductase YedYZ molybdopterin-dependent catalytic subunit